MPTEPYRCVIETEALGVNIVITATVQDSDGGQEEANRRAKTIADHFKLIIPRS